MRQLAVTVSAIGFFVLAAVGYLSGVSIGTCALRAGIGAVALYVLTSIAARLALSIFVDAVVKSRTSSTRKAEHDGN